MEFEAKDNTYRDQLATLNEQGKRQWVYAKKPKGKLYTYRNIVAYTLLTLLFAIPFVKVNGEPFILLNVLERKFILFGVHFWPQDFHIFFYAMITLFVFVVLFTVSFGRIWCGWTCPQTVFMEFIFRKIEYLIEGTPQQQRKLDSMPMNFEKFGKKGLKHILFYLICFIITNTFLSYIIGVDELWKIVTDTTSNHKAELTAVLVFAGVMYFVFAKFREQVCAMVCPYGRLQGVLLDSNSIVVAYDYKRGEERSPLEAGENRTEEGKGDCIDCYQCVDVCPTGIDVRDGTQLECINCTACIDECNSVMEWIKRPKGLIRFDSEKNIAEGTQPKWPARKIAYSVVLAVLFSVLVGLFMGRTDVEAIVLRTPGLLFQKQDKHQISNMYNFKVVNKTNRQMPIQFKVMQPEGIVKMVGRQLIAEPSTIREGVFFVLLPEQNVTTDKIPIQLGVYSGNRLLDKIDLTFVGPNK
ncbi:MAG: cytochrome c oxidase accessory protein CcoG [Marinifilaceae bacterium]